MRRRVPWPGDRRRTRRVRRRWAPAGRAVEVLLVVAVLLSAPNLAAQPLRSERQAFAHLMDLRTELLDAWLAASPQRRSAAALVFEPDGASDPFATMATALAALHGRKPGPFDRIRAGSVVLGLPQVVDGATFEDVHVTIHTPRLLPADFPPLVFEVELRDAAGALLTTATIGGATEPAAISDSTSPEALARFRATAPLSMRGRAVGRYRAIARVRIDGGEPVLLGACEIGFDPEFPGRAGALPLVVDGRTDRVAAAAAIFAALPERRRSGLDAAILRGVVWSVERPYSGEPRVPGSDPELDLARAESVLAALQADEPALDQLHGRTGLGVPIGPRAGSFGPLADWAMVSVDVDDCRSEDESRPASKPLVLFVPGAPSWTSDARRPDSPQSLHPAWIADQLARAGFDRAGSFHVAVMESPGRYRSSTGAVLDVLEQLRAILPVSTVFLVGEREGAYAVSRAALDPSTGVTRVVTIDGGAITRRELEAAPHISHLLIATANCPAAGSLEAITAAAAPTDRAHFTARPDIPWPLALAASASTIETFLTN